MPRRRSVDSSLKLRDTTQLTPPLERKLSVYAALATASGVAILALTQSAQAKVIYTATHQKIPLNTNFALDLNGDGIVDFNFFGYTRLGPAAPRHDTYTFNSDADLEINVVANSNQVWGVHEAVSALSAGVKIGGSGMFSPTPFVMGGVGATDGEPPAYYGPWAPEGGNVKDKYVGLKFVISGEIHYGWARLNAQIRQPTKGNLQAVLTGYAYQTIPNAPIFTVQTSGPETGESQGTVGHLALGSTSGQ